MAKIHVMLQGKGGVGKSVVMSFTAQYAIQQAIAAGLPAPICIDTDPVNSSFVGYKALDVKRLDILENEEINPRAFDMLVEQVAPAKSAVIVDNGSSSFVPLSRYLITNEVPSLLHEMGHELVIHTVITGGQALLDTVAGFGQLVSQFPTEALFVVWVNPFWGPIEHEGKSFEQMKAYKDNKDRVSAIIHLPTYKEETYGRDLSEMLQDRLTFDEAIAQPALTIMTRQRLKIIKAQIFGLMDNAAVL